MSHAVGPNSGHSPRAGTRTTKKPGAASIVDVVKVFLRLLPKQLKDEAQLAVLELKAKGIKLGIGAAFAVVGLIFLGLAVIALVGAAIAGLSHVMPAWLAALLLATTPEFNGSGTPPNSSAIPSAGTPVLSALLENMAGVPVTSKVTWVVLSHWISNWTLFLP